MSEGKRKSARTGARSGLHLTTHPRFSTQIISVFPCNAILSPLGISRTYPSPFTPSPFTLTLHSFTHSHIHTFTPSPLNYFKIALQLPVGDRLAELAFLPFAGGGEVLDECIAEA